MGYIIFYLLFAIITQLMTYKWIRKIDKKERQELQEWETDYIIKTNDLIRQFKEDNKKTKEKDINEKLEKEADNNGNHISN